MQSVFRTTGVMFILLFLFSGSVLYAQPTPNPEVNKLMSEFMDAWNTDFPEAFEEIFDENVTFIGQGFPILGKSDLIEKWVKWQMPTSKDLKVIQVFTDGISDNIAYQTGRWSLLFIPTEGDPVTTTGSHSFIWKKSGDKWLLHSIMIANDPPKQQQ